MVIEGFFFHLILIIGLIALLISSYTDIKTREVPDWISYGLIFLGLGLRLIFSFATFDWSYIINGLFGFGIFLALALLMFYSGQWGGGDSKVLMGLGALLGFGFRLDDFFIAFIVNALIIGAFYGLIWSIVLAIRHRKKFVVELKKLKTKKLVWLKRFMLVLVLLLLIATYFVKDFLIAIVLIIFALMIFLMYYFWIFSRAVEKACMYRLVEPEKLTIGDWIAKEVKVGRRIIVGPKNLGIEEKQIKELIRLKRKNKIKKVLIKEGIPFVPAFLIGFIFTYFFGNVFLLFI